MDAYTFLPITNKINVKKEDVTFDDIRNYLRYQNHHVVQNITSVILCSTESIKQFRIKNPQGSLLINVCNLSIWIIINKENKK